MRSLIAAIFLTTLPALATHAAEVDLNGHKFQIPDGFSIELAAPSSLADRPINATLSPDGKLFVTVSSGSTVRPVEAQNKDPKNRVLCLEDTTGSGRYDKATVFAENVPFPEGILWHDHALYVSAPPAIWKFTDSNGDNISDERAIWFDGKTITGCANDLHGPYAGPDGFLYWTKGAFAEQEVPHLRKRSVRKDRAAHIMRAKPDGSQLEAVMSGGMDNPVGLDFTFTGEPIFSSTFIDLSGEGKRDGLGHAVRGAVFPKINDVTNDVPRTGPLLPALTHFGAGAPSGTTRLRSAALGGEYRENFLTALFNLRKVVRHRLEPFGSTYRSNDSDFLVSDNQDFHPTDVLEDSDGSILIVDTGGWYKVCCPTSQLAKPEVLGAIYRIKKNGSQRPLDPYGKRINFNALSHGRLVDLLADQRTYVVESAIREIANRGKAVVPELQLLFRQKALEPQVSAPALRALFLNATPTALSLVREGLSHRSEPVRILAIQLAAHLRDPSTYLALTATLKPERSQWSEHLRRAGMSALGQLGSPQAIAPLFQSYLSDAGDQFLEHAFILALIEIDHPQETRDAMKKFPGTLTQRAGLIALSEMQSGDITSEDVIPHLLSPDAILREAATFIATRHPDWAADIAKHLSGTLASPLPPIAPEVLQDLLTRIIKEQPIQDLLASMLKSPTHWAAITSLNTVASSSLKSPPSTWISQIADLLKMGPGAPDVRTPLLAATKALLPHPSSKELLLPALQDYAELPKLPAKTRIAAALVLPESSPLRPETFRAAFDNINSSSPLSDKLTASEAIGRSTLSAEQRSSLLASLPKLDAIAALRVLPGLIRGASEQSIDLTLSSLLTLPDRNALNAPSLRSALRNIPTNLAAKRDELLDRLDASVADQRRTLIALESSLPSGDISRGRSVFNSQKASCNLCHQQGYQGGKLGPDLTSIGAIRSRTDLLEAIVFPSASFVRSYEPVTLRTRNQGDIKGIIRSESNANIRVATAPNAETSIARELVLDILPDSTSLMPAGYDRILTPQELSDLVAFLESCGKKSSAQPPR